LKTATVSDCQEETAWGGNKYLERKKGGNWMLIMEAGNYDDAYLVAGQNMSAGYVNLIAKDGYMTVVIDLFEDCWSLQNVDEPIKIQALDALPDKNPPPGKFTSFKGVVDSESHEDINGVKYLVYKIHDLPEKPYYLVHVDVQNCCK